MDLDSLSIDHSGTPESQRVATVSFLHTFLANFQAVKSDTNELYLQELKGEGARCCNEQHDTYGNSSNEESSEDRPRLGLEDKTLYSYLRRWGTPAASPENRIQT
jgi:hypothetical protein